LQLSFNEVQCLSVCFTLAVKLIDFGLIYLSSVAFVKLTLPQLTFVLGAVLLRWWWSAGFEFAAVRLDIVFTEEQLLYEMFVVEVTVFAGVVLIDCIHVLSVRWSVRVYR
jgi:hypothetical protein